MLSPSVFYIEILLEAERETERASRFSLFTSGREQEFSLKEREGTSSLSLLEAASLSQLEAVLLDVASLDQLAAASLSLGEALSFLSLK